MKTKMKNLDSEVEKRYKLFKAYTSHDSLVGKIEGASKKSENLEKILQNKDKQHFMKMSQIQKQMNEKFDKQGNEILQLQEKIKSLQFSSTTHRRVMIANQINGVKKRVVSISSNSHSRKDSNSPDRVLKIDVQKKERNSGVSQKSKYIPMDQRAKSDDNDRG